MDALRQDLRQSLRGLKKSPGVTIALLTLTLGIGVNTAIFSLIDAVMLRPLPYPHGDRIVSIWEKKPNGQPNSMTTLNYLDYAKQSTVFERIAATTNCCAPVTLTDGGAPMLTGPAHVSASYFDVLGAGASLGRTFQTGDDTPGHDHIVILSHDFWASRFNSDPTRVGRAIHLDNEPYTVVGVLPADSPFDRMFSRLWVPLTFTPANTGNAHWLITTTGAAVGLLKPGVTLKQARAEMDGIAGRLAIERPEINKGWGVIVNAYATEIVGRDTRQSLYLLWAAVAVVLLIACVNVANLLLARGLDGRREISVKLALGATPGRLVRQLLMESLMLSSAGAALGLGVGHLAVGTLLGAMRRLPLPLDVGAGRPIPAEAVVALDGRVIGLSIVLSVLCAALFGVVPAIHAIRSARADVGFGQRVSAGREHVRLRSLLIVAEIALASVSFMSATLLMRSLGNMARADVGFDAANVITAEMPIRSQRFTTPDGFLAYLQRVKTRIDALPGVRGVAFTADQPMEGISYGAFIQIVGQPARVRAERPVASLRIVSASYFAVMRLRLRRGRTLTDADHASTPLVAVINETLARQNFEDHDPIGQHVLVDASNFCSTQASVRREETYDVVGVVADERISSFDDARPRPIIYLSNEQHPSDAASDLVVRTATEPSMLEPSLRRAVAEVDPDQALANARTVAAIKDETVAPDRFRAALLGLFSTVALLLAAIGIYGVTSYSVGQRRHEMGIRTALGASRANLIRLVVGGGMRLAGAGLAIGCAAGLVATRLLRAFLFGVTTTDMSTMAVTISVLATVAAAALFLPARRAGRVNPIEALRAD